MYPGQVTDPLDHTHGEGDGVHVKAAKRQIYSRDGRANLDLLERRFPLAE